MNYKLQLIRRPIIYTNLTHIFYINYPITSFWSRKNIFQRISSTNVLYNIHSNPRVYCRTHYYLTQQHHTNKHIKYIMLYYYIKCILMSTTIENNTMLIILIIEVKYILKYSRIILWLYPNIILINHCGSIN